MIKKIVKPKNILILILLTSLFLRLFRLDYPEKFVFDEVYHAFTAQEYLKNNKEAWEWWTTPPPGVAFEWTHPPLAKEIMAISMYVLKSDSGWAWRLPGVLMGTISVYLVYLLGKKLFKNDTPALLAAFLFSLDGLNFVQSRTGMNDIYFITFILSSLYLFLSKRFLLSAVFLGFSLSSKWASVYSYIIFIPLLALNKQTKKIAIFLTVPLIVYFFTYLPFFTLDHTADQFVELHKQMWWYHTSLKASHDYASHALSWPLNLYPVWYFVDYKDNLIANIFASGNPLLFWLGSLSIIVTLWEAFRKKSLNLFVIVLGFFAFWLPWIVSPRIMFLYHFSPSVPFLCLSLAYQMNKHIEKPETRKITLLLILLIAISFMLLYPFLTGIHLLKNTAMFFFFTNITKNPFQ